MDVLSIRCLSKMFMGEKIVSLSSPLNHGAPFDALNRKGPPETEINVLLHSLNDKDK